MALRLIASPTSLLYCSMCGAEALWRTQHVARGQGVLFGWHSSCELGGDDMAMGAKAQSCSSIIDTWAASSPKSRMRPNLPRAHPFHHTIRRVGRAK